MFKSLIDSVQHQIKTAEGEGFKNRTDFIFLDDDDDD